MKKSHATDATDAALGPWVPLRLKKLKNQDGQPQTIPEPLTSKTRSQ